MRLKDLRLANLQMLYSEKLKSGLSKRTVKYIHAIMHQSLYRALKWGLVAGNVADAAESPFPVHRVAEHLTREQIANSMDT